MKNILIWAGIGLLVFKDQLFPKKTTRQQQFLQTGGTTQAFIDGVNKTRYRVHAEGYGLKTSDEYFTSKKAAIEYMKKWYDFYKEWDADLFTMIKEYDDDSEWVQTKYTIVNI